MLLKSKRKQFPLTMARINHTPQKREKIRYIGVVESVEIPLARNTDFCFVRTQDGNVVMLDRSPMHLSLCMEGKFLYFARLNEMPEMGKSYRIKRWTLSLFAPEEEDVICGKLLLVRPIWSNFYYVETKNSAYYIIT